MGEEGGGFGGTPEPSEATGGAIGKRRLAGTGTGTGGVVVSKKHL